MQNKHRIAALAMAAVLVFSACGKSKPSEPVPEPNSQKPFVEAPDNKEPPATIPIEPDAEQESTEPMKLPQSPAAPTLPRVPKPDASSSSQESEKDSDNSSGGGSGGSSTNPPKTQVVINELKSGIIAAEGINYAVLSLTPEASNGLQYSYSVSGREVTSASAVNTKASVVKIELPDASPRTVAVKKDGTVLQILQLGALGESKTVNKEELDDSMPTEPSAPYLVYAKDMVHLGQYLNFVYTPTGAPYIEPHDEVVFPQAAHSNNARIMSSMVFASRTQTPSSKSVVSKVDAVTSATKDVPTDLDIEIEADIAIRFQMIVNSMIAKELGYTTANIERVLEKWNALEKTIVVDRSQTIYMGYKEFTQALETCQSTGTSFQFASAGHSVQADTLPKTVKYMLDEGIYGTKVDYSQPEPRVDSKAAPTITAAQSVMHTNPVLRLSEKNETWYRFITQIIIADSNSKEYQYHSTKKLSDDGLELTLAAGQFGPLHYAGFYNAVIKSHGFDDVIVPLEVVNPAATFTATWDNGAGTLLLKPDVYTYIAFNLQQIGLNGSVLGSSDYSIIASNIAIPYRLLSPGANTLKIKGASYADSVFSIHPPEGFVPPLAAPAVTLQPVLEGKDPTILLTIENADDSGWLDLLSADNVKLYSGSSLKELESFQKSSGVITLATKGMTFNSYSEYKLVIAVPGYESVTKTIKPVQAPPAVTQEWQPSYSLKLSVSGSASYLANDADRLILGERALIKGIDYEISGSSLLLYARNFTAPNTSYVLQLGNSSGKYASQTITITTPAGFTLPKEGPSVSVPSVISGSGILVQLPNGSVDWLNSLVRIRIQRGSSTVYTAERAALQIQSNEILIPYQSAFSSSGSYMVTVEASGYQDVKLDGVKVLKKAPTLKATVNYDTDIVEITGNDYSFYGAVQKVLLNGEELPLGNGYTKNSNNYSILIPSGKFVAQNNTVTILATDYSSVSVTVDKYAAPAAAPEAVAQPMYNTKDNPIHVTVSGATAQDWLAQLKLEHIQLKKSSYSNAVLGSLVVDSNGFTVTTQGETLSATTSYQMIISVPNHKSLTIGFKPRVATAYSWLSNGNLQISAVNDSSYLNSYVSQVQLGNTTLTKETDYQIKNGSLILFPKHFQAQQTYSVTLVDGSGRYETVSVAVTTPHDYAPPIAPPTLQIPEAVQNAGFTIVPAAGSADWLAAVESIQVGTYTLYTITKDKLTIANGVIIVPNHSAFYNVGSHNVTVQAKGYADAQASLTVVKKAPTFTKSWNDQTESLSLQIQDYSYPVPSRITLNGRELVQANGEFTVSNSSYLNISVQAALFTETENELVVYAKGYAPIKATIEKNPLLTLVDAPTVSLKQIPYQGGNSLTLLSEDAQWLSALRKEDVSITRGSTNFEVAKAEAGEGEVVLTLASYNTFSSSYSYTVAIKVPGYRTVTLTFTPVKSAPAGLTATWQEDGSLQITDGVYSYYYANIHKILVNGTALEKETYNITPPVISISSSNFIPGMTYTVELLDSRATGGYETVKFTVTTPTLPDAEMQDPAAEPTEIPPTEAEEGETSPNAGDSPGLESLPTKKDEDSDIDVTADAPSSTEEEPLAE